MGPVSHHPATTHPDSHPPFDLAAPALRIKRVMVCTDFSEISSRAVDEAYRLCLHFRAELSLLFVLEHDDLSEWPDAEKELALLSRQRRQDLDALAARLATPSIHVRPMYRDGQVVNTILEAIGEESPDIVVVGTHGKRGLERLFVGSTAEAVIRNAPGPVMTVGPGFIPASSQRDHGPVVYATDFYDGAEESMTYAAYLSGLNQGPLHCIHVLPKTFVQKKNHIVAAIMESALADLQSTFGKDCFEPSYRTLFGREVSRTIVEYAREVNASSIVLGVTRRSSLTSHLPLGQVSQIMILATCPVFTLTHERYVSPLMHPQATQQVS